MSQAAHPHQPLAPYWLWGQPSGTVRMLRRADPWQAVVTVPLSGLYTRHRLCPSVACQIEWQAYTLHPYHAPYYCNRCTHGHQPTLSLPKLILKEQLTLYLTFSMEYRSMSRKNLHEIKIKIMLDINLKKC